MKSHAVELSIFLCKICRFLNVSVTLEYIYIFFCQLRKPEPMVGVTCPTNYRTKNVEICFTKLTPRVIRD